MIDPVETKNSRISLINVLKKYNPMFYYLKLKLKYKIYKIFMEILNILMATLISKLA